MALRLNPYERFTLRNLAQALGSGLDPGYAESIFTSTLDTARDRQLQQQQIVQSLAQMAYEQAAGGMPEEQTQDFIGSMSSTYPFLNKENPYSQRQQGILGETLENLYPEQPPGQYAVPSRAGVQAGVPYGATAPPSPDAGLSPLYTVPRDQEMQQAVAQSRLESDLNIEQAQAMLPIDIQRAQAEAQIGLDTQLQGALMESQLPGLIGPQPLTEEERMSIGQLVSARVQAGLSLPEIRQEVLSVTVGMDPTRAEEAQQFAVQAWSDLTGSSQAESTQLVKVFQLALSQSGMGGLQEQALGSALGGVSMQDLAQQLAGAVASNPALKQKLPELLQALRVPFAAPQVIGWILQQRLQGQAAQAAPVQPGV